MTFKFNENLLQYIWEKQLFDKKTLITTEGIPIQVVHVGFLNKNGGPDFINAKIKIGNFLSYTNKSRTKLYNKTVEIT